MITLDTYIISDTHFFHKNIVRYCNRPENHNNIMWDNWNAIVGPNDQVLHLGDLHFMKKSHIPLHLNGEKFIIKGNHDHGKSWELWGFKEVKPFIQKFGEGRRIYFTHYPTNENFTAWDLNIHGHIHNKPYETNMLDGHLNVSIEMMQYKPWRLRDILNSHNEKGEFIWNLENI